jgi:RNA polymerase sigma factor (sigma-70 family)
MGLPMDDTTLLERFARDGSPDAFGELVARHTNLVYACALRRLRDPHAAQDVTQGVFLALALKAKSLRPGTPLVGWLFTATRFACAKHQRGAQRRQEREMHAHEQFTDAAPPAALWRELEPHLESALESLSATDRAAVLLRFHQQASHAQVAATLHLSEAATKKRVNRALEKLRRFFARKGVTLTVTVLGGLLGANVVQAAPAGLAVTATATALGGTAVATQSLLLAKGTLQMMLVSKLKTAALVTAACAVVTGTGVVVAQRAAPARVEGPPAGGAVTASPSTPPKGGTPTTPVPAGKMSAAETCAAPWLRRAAREVTGISSNAPQMWVWGDIAQQWARLGNMAEFNAALRNLEQLDAADGNKAFRADLYRYGGIVRLIPQLVRNGQVAEATKLCDDLPAAYQAGAKATLGQALAETGRLAEARAVAESLTGNYADNVKFGIATGLAQAGLTADALEAVKSLSPPLQNNVYISLMNAQAKTGDYAAARQTIQGAPAFVRDSAWAMLCGQQLERGDLAAAKESLLAISAPEHRARIHLGYCSALVRNGRLDEAKATALEMVGQPQELSAFNAVCEELIKRGDEAGAAAFREQISPQLRDRAAKDYRYLLVKAAADAGDAQRAARHLEAMPAAERSASAYLNEAAALAQAAPDGGKRWAQFLETMPTTDRSVSPYLRVAIALAKTQDTDGSRRYLELAKTADPKLPLVRFYKPLAAEMAKADNVEAALGLARELPENQGRASVLGVVANGCTEAGQFERALTVIQGMPAVPDRIWSAQTLASSAARKGRWTDLSGWIDALPGAEDRARACVSVAVACFGVPADTAATATAAGGVTGKVFKPIDQSQSGFYADGKWSYAYEVRGDQRQGVVKYDAKDVGHPQPGDYIQTPWGWMQWQEKGHWLPVAEKPATGTQLPDPGKK